MTTLQEVSVVWNFDMEYLQNCQSCTSSCFKDNLMSSIPNAIEMAWFCSRAIQYKKKLTFFTKTNSFVNYVTKNYYPLQVQLILYYLCVYDLSPIVQISYIVVVWHEKINLPNDRLLCSIRLIIHICHTSIELFGKVKWGSKYF